MAHDEVSETRAKKELQARRYQVVVEVLMRAYGKEIYRYALTRLSVEEDAEDALQTVFVQAFRALPKFEQKSSFRTWLYSIARNACLDRIKMDQRRRMRISTTEHVPDIADESREASDLILSDVLSRCLQELSNNVRDAVLLRYQVGLSYSEISAMANEKPGTLQARVARALPVLRHCLEQHGARL